MQDAFTDEYKRKAVEVVRMNNTHKCATAINGCKEKEQNSLDEIKLFIYGRIMCSMAAVWRMYGYQDYPAPEPPVCAFKVRSGAQLNDFIRLGEITELQIRINNVCTVQYLRIAEQ